MLNMLKMDLYRMFKSRSCYVILLIMILVTLLTTYLEAQPPEEESAEVQTYLEEQQETIEFGMSVSVSSVMEAGEQITVLGMFYANSQAKALGLFLVIFTVIFSTADINNGYIKNIGGQVKSRWKLMISRAFSILVYTVIFLGLFILFQAVSNRIFLGYLEWGDGKAFLTYLGIAVLLNFALEMICMAISVLVRNNVFSMIFAICLCMNLMILLYNAIDRLIAKTGVKDFQLFKYTVTGKIAVFPINPTGQECAGAVLIALIFSAAAILLSCVVFEKRDI